MATKVNFEQIFGIYRDDHIADFISLDNDTKRMLYSELYVFQKDRVKPLFMVELCILEIILRAKLI